MTTHNKKDASMDRNIVRRVAFTVVLAFICIFMVGRSEGFENIRAVQFLLIFISGALIGLAIGIVRQARRPDSTP